jgi:hypothetical protein
MIESTILFMLAAIPKLRDSPINSNSALHDSITTDKGLWNAGQAEIISGKICCNSDEGTAADVPYW